MQNDLFCLKHLCAYLENETKMLVRKQHLWQKQSSQGELHIEDDSNICNFIFVASNTSIQVPIILSSANCLQIT